MDNRRSIYAIIFALIVYKLRQKTGSRMGIEYLITPKLRRAEIILLLYLLPYGIVMKSSAFEGYLLIFIVFILNLGLFLGMSYVRLLKSKLFFYELEKRYGNDACRLAREKREMKIWDILHILLYLIITIIFSILVALY